MEQATRAQVPGDPQQGRLFPEVGQLVRRRPRGDDVGGRAFVLVGQEPGAVQRDGDGRVGRAPRVYASISSATSTPWTSAPRRAASTTSEPVPQVDRDVGAGCSLHGSRDMSMRVHRLQPAQPEGPKRSTRMPSTGTPASISTAVAASANPGEPHT